MRNMLFFSLEETQLDYKETSKNNIGRNVKCVWTLYNKNGKC